MFGALYRMHFPLNAEGQAAASQRAGIPRSPGHPKTEPRQTALKGGTPLLDVKNCVFDAWSRDLLWRGCKDLRNAGAQPIPEDLNADREQNERGKTCQDTSA